MTNTSHGRYSAYYRFAIVAAVVSGVTFAQQPRPETRPTPGAQAASRPATEAPAQVPVDYTLGAGDQISIRAFEVEEISDRTFRVDPDGTLNLPLVGRVKAAGLTVMELEAQLVQLLQKYVKTPQVTVTVVQFRTAPVFVVGAFTTPGVFQLQGRKTLVDLLTAVGGLAPNATRRVKLTRKPDSGAPALPGAVVNPKTGGTSLEISLEEGSDLPLGGQDVVLYPNDIVSAERAEMIFISGEVGRVGGIEIGGRESLSVMQAISMAGGFGRDASLDRVKVLRPVLNTARRAEIPVNVQKIMTGEANDFPLQPNDILYVPRNAKRQLWTRVGVVSLAVIPTAALILR